MYPFDLPDHTLSLLRRQSNSSITPNEKDKHISPVISSIKGISLTKLVEKIVFFDDTELLQYFLLCYRSLCKPLQLAKLLEARYIGPDVTATKHQISYFAANKEIIRPRTLHFFSEFIDTLHGPDFAGEEGDELFEMVSQFSQDNDCFTQDQLLRMLALRKRGHALSDPGKTLSIISYKSSDIDVQPHLSVDDIVHEIITQESALFCKVHPAEFLSLAWSTKHKYTRAPTITKLIEIFNWVTTWISTRILMCTTPESRCNLIEFFISVGKRMKELNNLNGMMEIESALNSTPIARLHQSWALISKESMDDFAQMTELMDCFQNFKAYRQYLSQIDPNVPCLPYIGLLLTDITFICEGNSTYVEQNLINVNYIKLLGSKLNDIERYQKNRYQVPSPASSIYMEVAYNSDDLYQLSKLREDKTAVTPKTRRNMSKQAARRTLSNTDFVPRVPPPTSEDRHILTANGKLLNFKQGEMIFAAGTRNDNLYYVASGKVSLHITVGKITEVVTETEKHNFFGLVAFLDGGTTWHDAVAVEPCSILEIQKPLVNQLLDYDVDFASRIYKCFANIISELIRRGQALINKLQKLQQIESVAINVYPQTPTSTPSSPMQKIPTSPMRTPSFQSFSDGKTIDTKSGLSDSRDSKSGGDFARSPQDKLSGQLFNISQVALKVYECKSKVFSGHLYIFPSYVCFHAKVFGFAKKIVIYCTNISDISVVNETSFIVQESSTKRYKFQMITEEDQKEAVAFSKTIMNKKNAPTLATAVSPTEIQLVENHSVSSVLTESEWMLLLEGAHLGTFPPGHVFIKEGSRPSGFFQIVKGECGIQVEIAGKTVTVAKRREGELFGEMSFLDEGAVASASVVASTEVEVYSLHESFANVLLNAHAGIAPKFYHYLGLVLVGRLRELDTRVR